MSTAIQFISDLRKEVSVLRSKGVTVVSAKKLEEVLAHAEAAGANISSGNIQLEVENVRASRAVDLELIKAAFVFAGDTLKAAILVNGGAAVALMSFTSAQWKDAQEQGVLGTAALSMASFVFGVGFAAIATGAAYAAQLHFAYGKDHRGAVFRGVGLALIIASYSAFFLGANQAYHVFVPR